MRSKHTSGCSGELIGRVSRITVIGLCLFSSLWWMAVISIFLFILPAKHGVGLVEMSTMEELKATVLSIGFSAGALTYLYQSNIYAVILVLGLTILALPSGR